jgi:hypothetical protein
MTNPSWQRRAFVTLCDDNNSLALQIVNYQFSQAKALNYNWDRNWLRVSCDVTSPVGHWQFIEPCLLTWEAKQLADWLDNIPPSNCPNDIDFTEPLLHFDCLGPLDEINFRLEVEFRLEALPRWAKEDEEYCIEIAVSGEQLHSAAAALRADLCRFPQR